MNIVEVLLYTLVAYILVIWAALGITYVYRYVTRDKCPAQSPMATSRPLLTD